MSRGTRIAPPAAADHTDPSAAVERAKQALLDLGRQQEALLRDHLRRHPWADLALAMGIGVALGLALPRLLPALLKGTAWTVRKGPPLGLWALDALLAVRAASRTQSP